MSLDDIDFDELEKTLDPVICVELQLLREQNAQLIAANQKQNEQLSKASEQITYLSEQIDDLRNMLFNRKS